MYIIHIESLKWIDCRTFNVECRTIDLFLQTMMFESATMGYVEKKFRLKEVLSLFSVNCE